MGQEIQGMDTNCLVFVRLSEGEQMDVWFPLWRTELEMYLEFEAHLTSMATIILQQHVIPPDFRLVEPFVLQQGNDLKPMSRVCKDYVK